MAGGARRLMGVFERHTLANGLRLLTAPMGHAQSVSCFIMLAAGSRYETPETNGIAHFAEHMFFKGTERRPTARDIGNEIDGIGGEFNAFTGKEYTGYYVRCAGEHRSIALDVLVDMLRHSKFDPEEIEREKGVIVEEMNMYFDTPRDYIGGVYDAAPLRRPAARLGHHRPQGDRPRGDPRHVPRLRRPLVQARAHGRRRRRQVDGDLAAEIERAARRPRAGETGAPAPRRVAAERRAARVKIHTKAVRPGAPLPRRAAAIRSSHPDRYALQLLATVLGDGHVVAALHRGARAARPRVLRLRASTTATPTRARSTRRPASTSTASTRRSRRSSHELKKIADEPVPADELEKARSVAKGRFVLQLENPQGLILFGLRREVLEGEASSRRRSSPALDAVTAEDVQRVAQDVIGGRARPRADRPVRRRERFEKLLGD